MIDPSLQYLHYMAFQRYPSEFQKTTAMAMWQNAFSEAFKQLRIEAKKAGYKHIILGPSPEHWKGGPSNAIYATPKIREGLPIGTVPLWKLSHLVGGIYSGNGLREADQMQLRFDSKSLEFFFGEYNLDET